MSSTISREKTLDKRQALRQNEVRVQGLSLVSDNLSLVSGRWTLLAGDLSPLLKNKKQIKRRASEDALSVGTHEIISFCWCGTILYKHAKVCLICLPKLHRHESFQA